MDFFCFYLSEGIAHSSHRFVLFSPVAMASWWRKECEEAQKVAEEQERKRREEIEEETTQTWDGSNTSESKPEIPPEVVGNNQEPS